jgi:V/A-type H+/Na+-transporting ATPase subunit A
MYSVPEKQVLILKIIMEFYKRCLQIIKAGAPLTKIVSLPVREKIVRVKSTVPNDDLGAIRDLESEINSSLDELERAYKGAKA